MVLLAKDEPALVSLEVAHSHSTQTGQNVPYLRDNMYVQVSTYNYLYTTSIYYMFTYTLLIETE